MGDSGADDRRLKITAIAFSAVILVVMFAVRTCMKSREAASSVPVPTATASPSNGKRCRVESSPPGALAYAVRGDERTALGLTPVDVDQGDYTIELQLTGYQNASVPVGVHDEPCTLQATLEPPR